MHTFFWGGFTLLVGLHAFSTSLLAGSAVAPLWTIEMPGAQPSELVSTRDGQVATLVGSNSESVVTVFDADGNALNSRSWPTWRIATLAANASGEIAVTESYGGYGFYVATWVFDSTLATTNWSLGTQPAWPYRQRVQATVLGDSGAVFHAGTLGTARSSGFDVAYSLSQFASGDYAYREVLHAGDSWHDEVQIRGASLSKEQDLVLAANEFPYHTRSVYQIIRSASDGTFRSLAQGDASLRQMELDPDGNVVVAGASSQPENFSYAAKISPSGIILWERRRPHERGLSVAASSDGSVYSATDFSVVKYLPDGREDWVLNLGATALACDNAGNLIAASKHLNASGLTKVVLRKISSDARLLWYAEVGSPLEGNDSLVRLRVIGDAVHVLADSVREGNHSAILAKYDNSAVAADDSFELTPINAPENKFAFVAPTFSIPASFCAQCEVGSVTVEVVNATSNDCLAVASASDAGWTEVNGVEVAQVSGGTNGTRLIIQMASASTKQDVERVVRQLIYLSRADEFVEPRLVRVTVQSSNGASQAAEFTIVIVPENDRPRPVPRILNLTDWGVVMFRGRTAEVIFDASATIDPDSTNVTFEWYPGNSSITNTAGVTVTNYLRPGTYTNSVEAIDHPSYSYGWQDFSFRVVRATEVVSNIRKMIRDKGLPMRARLSLLRPLNRCDMALRREEFMEAHTQVQQCRATLDAISQDPSLDRFALWNLSRALEQLDEQPAWPE